MKELEIECKGVGDIRWYQSDGMGLVTLNDVTMGFLESVPAKDIVLYCNNKALLDEMDEDEIIDYISEKFYVEIKGKI